MNASLEDRLRAARIADQARLDLRGLPRAGRLREVWVDGWPWLLAEESPRTHRAGVLGEPGAPAR